MLAIVDSVLIRPVNLPHAEQLVHFARMVRSGHPDDIRFQDFEALRAHSKSFEAPAGTTSLPEPVTTPDGTRTTLLHQVEPGFFGVTGISARFGRVFTEEDSHAPLAVVTDAFWQNRLGGSRRAVGSAIKVDNRVYTVAGVMPPGFSFPYLEGEAVYIPLFKRLKTWTNTASQASSYTGEPSPASAPQQRRRKRRPSSPMPVSLT